MSEGHRSLWVSLGTERVRRQGWESKSPLLSVQDRLGWGSEEMLTRSPGLGIQGLLDHSQVGMAVFPPWLWDGDIMGARVGVVKPGAAGVWETRFKASFTFRNATNATGVGATSAAAAMGLAW